MAYQVCRLIFRSIHGDRPVADFVFRGSDVEALTENLRERVYALSQNYRGTNWVSRHDGSRVICAADVLSEGRLRPSQIGDVVQIFQMSDDESIEGRNPDEEWRLGQLADHRLS